MSESAEYEAEQEQPCQCQSYLRATERAALVSARWLGRDDEDAAEESAATGMRATLDILPISGRVVFGSLDDSGGLTPGAIVGGGGKEVDLALDPLEGRGVVARGGNGAMSMIAVGDPGRHAASRHLHAEDGRRPEGPWVDRPAAPGRRQHRGDRGGVRAAERRGPAAHHDLIEEIRNSGARTKLIQDGDVTAAISAAIRGTNDHLAIGIGGTRQAVLSAAAFAVSAASCRPSSGRRRAGRSTSCGRPGSSTTSVSSAPRISRRAR